MWFASQLLAFVYGKLFVMSVGFYVAIGHAFYCNMTDKSGADTVYWTVFHWHATEILMYHVAVGVEICWNEEVVDTVCRWASDVIGRRSDGTGDDKEQHGTVTCRADWHHSPSTSNTRWRYRHIWLLFHARPVVAERWGRVINCIHLWVCVSVSSL